MLRQTEIENLIMKGFELEIIALELDLPLEYIIECNKNVEERTLKNNLIRKREEEESAFLEIKILRKQGRFEEAKILAEKFSNNGKIQSQMIKIYMMQGKYEEALEICDKFPNDLVIQSQKVTLYMKTGKYEEAIEICEKFPSYLAIQSQMITIFIMEGRYEEARNIGLKFPEDATIQSQMITICIKTGKYKEAREIGAKFPEEPTIQSQMITIYMKEGKYKEVREIGAKFPEEPSIQSQMINTDIVEENREKRKNRKKYPDNSTVQSHISTKNQEEFLLEILNEIKDNPGNAQTREKIDRTEDKWIKMILNSALAERVNLKAPVQQFIKQLNKQGYVDDIHKPIVNELEKRLQQKTKIFDVNYYLTLINKVIHKNNNNKTTHTTTSEDGRE